MSDTSTVINPIAESAVINPIEVGEPVDSHAIDIVPPFIQRVLSQTSSTSPPPPPPILKRSLSSPVTSKEKELTSGDKTMLTSITTNLTSLSTNIFGKEVVETFFVVYAWKTVQVPTLIVYLVMLIVIVELASPVGFQIKLPTV